MDGKIVFPIMKNRFYKTCILLFAIAFVSLENPQKLFSYSVRDFDAIDKQLEVDIKSYHIPGMALIVVDEDKVLFSKTYGKCKNIDAPFLIGSMSKSFTALSIMQLEEQGKVDLNASISKYIDCSLYLKNKSDGDKITVKQLLNQTSGLGTYQKFGNAKITKTYGTYLYSNMNYNLLGKIIEAVSGESYSDYVERNIFEPLKMEKTSATYENSKADGLIKGYRNYFGFPVSGDPDYPNDRSWSRVPAGYISSSVADIGKYLQMYLNGGEGIVSEQSINTMFYDTVPSDENGTSFYGMGWVYSPYVSELGESVLNHAGLVENFTSNMFILPESKIGVAFLVNMNDYFVDNNLIGNIIMPFLGCEQKSSSKHTYMLFHLLLDLVYFVILFLAVLPLVFIKRWKKKSYTVGRIIFDVLCHGVFPIFLLCLSMILGIPLWVLWYFVKDLFFVLVISSALLFVIGGYKVVLIFQAFPKSACNYPAL